MALIRFTKILEPIYRSLTCLESSNSTIGDVFAYWLAVLAALDRLFSTDDCGLLPEAVARFRGIVNSRYLEAVDDAPVDIYPLGFFLHLGKFHQHTIDRKSAAHLCQGIETQTYISTRVSCRPRFTFAFRRKTPLVL